MTDFSRFVQAQKCYFQTALNEIADGERRTHWIVYLFPQIKGIGYSSESVKYSLANRAEAEEYLKDEFLKGRLLEITQALLDKDADLSDLLGYPEDEKVKASLTLFKAVCPEEDIFDKALKRFFNGEEDEKTKEILESC